MNRVKDTSSQETPAAVTERTKQAGDKPQWLTLESSAVWTERMWATLERGIKGGQWHSPQSLSDFVELGLISLKAFAQSRSRESAHERPATGLAGTH